MIGELVKRQDRWDLYCISDGSKIASTSPNPLGKLSLKNCESIANGYDLDELAREHYFEEGNPYSFKEGFQKAMELMEGKKYSEMELVEILKLYSIHIQINFDTKGIIQKPDKYIQSLQQNEWDVEIQMICPHPMDTYVCGMQYGCDEDGCNHPNQIPYLDKNGCLILKHKFI